MNQKTVAPSRRSKRQKGEDASVEPLLKQPKRRKLNIAEENDHRAEEAVTDTQTATGKYLLEEEPVQNNSEKERELPEEEGESPEKEGESPEKEGELPEEEGESPEKEGESPEKGGESPEKEGESPEKEARVETANNTEDTQHSTEPGQAQQSQTNTKRRRGRTRMSKVAKNHEDKVEVEFISLGEHVGDGSVTLSSFLGPLVREHVPVLLGDWRHLDEQTKDRMWEEIQARFKLTEQWQKDSVLKQMGCIWRSSKSRLVTLVRAIGSREQLINLKPSNVQSVTVWMNWVKMKKGNDFKVQSDKFRELRRSQIPHTTSRKGMVRLAHEMKKNSSDPTKVTRSKVWVAGHTHSDGRPVRPEFEETIEKIKSIDSEMESTGSMSVNEDAVSQVLGKDKPGRIRGMGRGITATKLAFMQARDSHVLKLEAKQAELHDVVRGLQDVVRGLTASKSNHQDGVSNSEVSDLCKGPRCQILDWCSEDDVVIGEGEFCSAEPTYKIGRIPLGRHAGAILVKSVIDERASVWRPTTSVTTLGEAIGVKIAWQLDKLILDEMDSSANNKNDDSSAIDAEGDNIQIYDWTKEDVLIAEGRLESSDPKKLVNNIPLGPNAAIVRVDRVLNEDGSLWRPNAEMLVIGDALGESIPWPIHKILTGNVQANRDELVSKSRSPVSASNSSNTSKNGKKKCILLDCKGSGKKVAEGRVFSSNPDDVVHFVPLGPNASKIWVDVPMIEDAPLWRTNSELQIIADAQGSIIAWPNDKLLYI